MIGYIDQYNRENEIEIGIAIGDQRYRGNGIGTEIFNGYAMALSERYKNKRITACVEKGNKPLKRMLIKSGFKYDSNSEDEYVYIFDRHCNEKG